MIIVNCFTKGINFMLIMTHRLYVSHDDDDTDPLVHLKLCASFGDLGVFKAGKSYMIKSRTKRGCFDLLDRLRERERIIPDPDNPEPYSIALGSYAFWDYKEFYCDALGWYVHSLMKKEDAFEHVTRVKEKIKYLEKKLKQLKPHIELSLEHLF